MKRIVTGIGVVVLIELIISAFSAKDAYRRVSNTSFGPGEHLEYRVHYGFLNAAEATVDVSPTLYKVNDRPCFRVNVHGRTVGAFDLVTRIRDTWRSYIDTTAIVPHKFYRNIQEGNYRKEESVTFDHRNNLVRAEDEDEKGSYKVPDNVQDIISGYYFLRTIDFNRLSVGQSIDVPAFFDEEVYNMRVRYRGKETIRTRHGRINVIKLNPILPANKLFKGEDAIRIWVSDDANKVPVKVEAELMVGAMEMDLKRHRGLKQDLRFYK